MPVVSVLRDLFYLVGFPLDLSGRRHLRACLDRLRGRCLRESLLLGTERRERLRPAKIMDRGATGLCSASRPTLPAPKGCEEGSAFAGVFQAFRRPGPVRRQGLNGTGATRSRRERRRLDLWSRRSWQAWRARDGLEPSGRGRRWLSTVPHSGIFRLRLDPRAVHAPRCLGPVREFQRMPFLPHPPRRSRADREPNGDWCDEELRNPEGVGCAAAMLTGLPDSHLDERRLSRPADGPRAVRRCRGWVRRARVSDRPHIVLSCSGGGELWLSPSSAVSKQNPGKQSLLTGSRANGAALSE